MNLASIDIGSNAVRLLFANIFYNANGKIEFEKSAFMRIPVRLGDDVFSSGVISEEKTIKLVKTIEAFKILININDIEHFDVCATSAMRNAGNSKEIVARIEQETGVKIRVITGKEEAEIIREAGINCDVKMSPVNMYVDVGGGSTEISITQNNKLVNSASFEIGTVRLLKGKVKDAEWQAMDKWLKQYKDYFGKLNCIGSGGNINKLTKMYGRKGDAISYKRLKKAYRLLSKMTYEERIENAGLRPDRADVIVPAAQIFCHVMDVAKCKNVTTPKFGLVDGMVFKLFLKMNKKSS